MNRYSKDFLIIFGFWMIIFVIYSMFTKAHAMIPRDEERKKIAVIDTGFDIRHYQKLWPYLCARGHKSFYGTEPFKDEAISLHGTNVVGLIAENIDPKEYCILIIKFFDNEEGTNNNLDRETAGINYAIEQGASFINLSLGGESPNQAEHDALKKAMAAGIRIVASAGNENHDLDKKCDFYPACYSDEFDPNMFHVVGTTGKSKQNKDFSNYGKMIRYIERGVEVGNPPNTGTSQAAAIHTGKWASGKIK